MRQLKFYPIRKDIKPHRTNPTVHEVCDAMFVLYEKFGFIEPWIGYLATDELDQVVGTCAFKTPPSNGRVEIAYFCFSEFEGQGIATMMAKYLIEVAQKHNPQIQIFAFTLAQENASNHILKKLGFKFLTEKNDPEDGLIWEWELEH